MSIKRDRTDTPISGMYQNRHRDEPTVGRTYPKVTDSLLDNGSELFEYATKLAAIAPYTSTNKWLLWVANQGFAAAKEKQVSVPLPETQTPVPEAIDVESLLRTDN